MMSPQAIAHYRITKPLTGTYYHMLVNVEGVGRSGIMVLRGIRTIQDAQVAYINHRDMTGLGASGYGDGVIFDNHDHHVARISYNGRLWPAGAYFAGMQPLAEALNVNPKRTTS